MAKGQLRSNKEAKKPKKDKTPTATTTISSFSKGLSAPGGKSVKKG